MKLLVLLAVVGVVLWWLRQRELPKNTAPPRTPQTPALPQDVLPCAHCGVHLPATDAVRGRHGVYCSPAHRLARGDVA